MSSELQEVLVKAGELLKSESRQLQRERDELQHERSMMLRDTAPTGGDVIELNVGGEVVTTLRSTLTQVDGSLLSVMFSGRWDDSLDTDKNGLPFLDFNPIIFKRLLSYLRCLRIRSPTQPLRFPRPSADLVEEWGLMVDYLGVLPALIGTPLSWEHTLPGANPGIAVAHNPNATTTLQPLLGGYQFAVAKMHYPTLEFTIVPHPSTSNTQPKTNQWLFLGICEERPSTNSSFNNPTAYGWAGGSQVLARGQHDQQTASGWACFKVGDVARLHCNKLDKVLELSFPEEQNRIQHKIPLEDVEDLDALYWNVTFNGMSVSLVVNPLV
eukprot:TRINITY_DN98772_c0_g1_i1.p1 TRINITY_DN98772_c0_g1~~TRINITY_DN98772_c0_g1_i1.p1  ORF type:complete len:326 (-),score=31.23 TRINITY_DN98772_c0_g1_i1:81-1058(-)